MKKFLTVFVMALALVFPSSLSKAQGEVKSVYPILNERVVNEPKITDLGPDGYLFLAKMQEQTDVKVKVVVYPDRASLREEAGKRGLDRFNTLAFANSYETPGTCTMHIVDPFYAYEPEIVGHEFLHCVYGQWHISNK